MSREKTGNLELIGAGILGGALAMGIVTAYGACAFYQGAKKAVFDKFGIPYETISYDRDPFLVEHKRIKK